MARPHLGQLPIRFSKSREYKLHGAAARLVYTQILSEPILDWLSTFPERWAALIYLLAGQYEHAGILGELVIQADRASVAQELGGNLERAMTAPKHSLQRQLVEGLRFLVAEQLKLNQLGASDGWLTTDALWLVSKTVADKLRAHLLSQGVEGIPSSNSTFFNVLQDHEIIQSNHAGKAIWKAAVDSGSWQMTLTVLKLSPALIWDADSRPAIFEGTVNADVSELDPESPPSIETSPLLEMGDRHHQASSLDSRPTPIDDQTNVTSNENVDMLLDLLGMASDTPEELVVEGPKPELSPQNSSKENSVNGVGSVGACSEVNNSQLDLAKLGLTFMTWVQHGIVTHRIVINDAKAKVHSVDGTAFIVTPEIFQRYAQELPQVALFAKTEGCSDWRLVQRSFEKLSLHIKRNDGLNIWTCKVQRPRKTKNVKGYLLKDPLSVFTEKPYDNPYLELIDSPNLEE